MSTPQRGISTARESSTRRLPFVPTSSRTASFLLKEPTRTESDAPDNPDLTSDQPLLSTGDTVVGRYQILGRAGHGAMGDVFDAWDRQFCRQVAIKFIKCPDEQATARFRREARALMSIHHESVLRIFDFGTEPLPYLVTEWLDGESLDKILARSERMPVATVSKVLSQICAGLQRCHDEGIIHRDIKPANIFILANGSARTIDFGLVKKARFSKIEDPTWEHQLTKGICLGTPRYMSPEQILDSEKVDQRSDLWSLAVVVYKMLTGKNAFKSTNAMGLFREILRCRSAPLPSKDTGDLPPALDIFFARALQHDPDARYRSAIEMAAEFSRLVSPERLEMTLSAPSGRRKKPPQSPVLVWKIATFGALAAAALGFLINRMPPDLSVALGHSAPLLGDALAEVSARARQVDLTSFRVSDKERDPQMNSSQPRLKSPPSVSKRTKRGPSNLAPAEPPPVTLPKAYPPAKVEDPPPDALPPKPAPASSTGAVGPIFE
jgi:serine/threonine-protein kinase